MTTPPLPNPPREPSSDMRQAARALHETFTALINEGFTERQALAVIGQILAANNGGSK